MSAQPLRVLVAEDSFFLRRGLVEVLDESPRLAVVASAEDLDGARELIEREQPDVVVTDIRMPPTKSDEGITLARELRTAHPEMGVVVLSEHASVSYALELFAGGGARRAYLIKDRVAEPEVIVDAVEAVAHGTPMLDPEIVGLIVGADNGHDVLDDLTERERAVLALLAAGQSNAAIARALELTKRGVERHINAIFSKLQLLESTSVNRRVLAALAYARATDDLLN